MELPFIYFVAITFPTLLFSAYNDIKFLLIDIRPLYFLIGLTFGGFYANNVSIWLAISVSIVFVIMMYFTTKQKIPMLGRADYALLQVFGLQIMLFSPQPNKLFLFATFFLALIIFLGLYRFLAKKKAFAPIVLFTYFLFGLTKLFYI